MLQSNQARPEEGQRLAEKVGSSVHEDASHFQSPAPEVILLWIPFSMRIKLLRLVGRTSRTVNLTIRNPKLWMIPSTSGWHLVEAFRLDAGYPMATMGSLECWCGPFLGWDQHVCVEATGWNLQGCLGIPCTLEDPKQVEIDCGNLSGKTFQLFSLWP